MVFLLKALPRRLPLMQRNQILVMLFNATAEAFVCPTPELNGLSFAERLQAYARFTSRQAEDVLRAGGDVAAVKTRLYRNACLLGEKVRRWVKADSLEEVAAIGQILYRAIEIDFQGDARGEVTVSSCYFSQFYSARVCDLISALDDGVFAGLSGGGSLVFSERMTECSQCCRAKLSLSQKVR